MRTPGGWWTDQVVPRMTDRSLSVGEVMKRREAVCADLSGRVLEVGFGSGLNLEKLPDTVTALDAVDPSGTAWSLSKARRSRTSVPLRRIGIDGQRLAADDASYDAVLCTFTLCTIPDPAAALAEVRRVLRPGASLRFLEHSRSPDRRTAAWQRRLEPVQRRMVGGCHLTRDPTALAEAAGLEVVVQQEGYLPGPSCARPWGWTVRGRATRPADPPCASTT